MKRIVPYLLLLPLFFCISCMQGVEPINKVIDRGLKRSAEQALLMAKSLEHKEGLFPKSIKNDSLETSTNHWWCCGFFPGQLWYLYEDMQTPELEHYAELFTARVEPAKHFTNTHDLGFMLYNSFGNGYRLTGNSQYKDILLTGAQSLATRYNEHIGLMRSWDFNKKVWQFPVIIDNMMNLEFLLWAAREGGDVRLEEMAVSHADKTLQYHFRDDFSTYHVVSYDTITALPEKKVTHQGYNDASAWARGEAWALYGYVMMYRETGRQAYLDLAHQIASFVMNHPNLPEDKIPYWDFDAPNIPDEPRDASAAAIIASALIELSQLDAASAKSKDYLQLAEDMLRSLSSPNYLAEVGSNCHFTLMHSTGSFPGNSEVDVPLTYADYYYVEALLRMKKVLEKK